jgi:hypothetical protein
MKKLFFATLLLFTSQFLSAQGVNKINLSDFEAHLKDQESYKKKELPHLPCVHLYALLNKYIHQKNKRISAKAIQALADFYSAAQQGDSCQEIRVQITKDYLTFIQTDSISSSKYGLMDIALGELGQVLSIEILKQVGGRDIILSLIKKKGRPSDYASSFIIPLQLVEIVPEIWEDFNNCPIENDSDLKLYFLKLLIQLDRVNAINVYKRIIWDYTKDTSKVIHQRYFYSLLDNIRYSGDKELVRELFKILEYLLSNPDKDKKIYIHTVSDNPAPIYWLLGETIYYNLLIQEVADLPEKFRKYPYPKYNKKNMEELLDWHKQNPSFKMKRYPPPARPMPR